MTIAISHTNELSNLISISERVSWTLSELFEEDSRFDFRKKFLPEAFFPLEDFSYLSREEVVKFNQILAYSYLNIFETCEEFIIGLTLDLSMRAFPCNRDSVRALTRFSDEEVKHQEMFRRAREMMQAHFSHELQVLDNATEVSEFILGHSKMSTLLLTIHLEIITRTHFFDGVREKKELDPFFAKILKFHWVEECQHIKIDIIEFNKLAKDASSADLDKVFDEYAEMVMALNQVLLAQANLNAEDLSSITSININEQQKKEMSEFVHDCFKTGLIKYAFVHPEFIKIFDDLYFDGKSKLDGLSEMVDQA